VGGVGCGGDSWGEKRKVREGAEWAKVTAATFGAIQTIFSMK